MRKSRVLLSLTASQLLIAGLAGCGFDDDDVDAIDGDSHVDGLADAATIGDLAYVPRISGTSATDIAHARGGLQCLTSFMQNTYATSRQTNICGLGLEADYSDEYSALYSGVDPVDAAHPVKTRRVVLAFTGTHRASDWIRNIESQGTTYFRHTNPMTGTYSYGWISAGWTDRWYARATQIRYHATTSVGAIPVGAIPVGAIPVGAIPVGTIASRMKEHVRLAKAAGQQIVFYVTGHSLGAAVGDVAGYDMASWLSEDTIQQEVVVATYDMPRYGYEGIRAAYQDRLSRSCSGPTAHTVCLTRWAMTRSLDPVQSIPVASPLSTYDQIYWTTSQTDPADRQVMTGSWPFRQIRTLPYCPQLNAPAITTNPLHFVDNHDYQHWTTDVANVSSAHLLCMFRRPGLSAIALSAPVADARTWSVSTTAGSTRRVLDVASGAPTVHNATGSNARFHLVDAGDHRHVLLQTTTAAGPRCLDLASGTSARAGDRLTLATCDRSRITQSWYMLPEDVAGFGRTSVPSSEPEGFYFVNALLGTALCPFDVGGSGAPIVSACASSSRWTFQP